MAVRPRKPAARRKAPKQQRSQLTYDAIIIAAEKILAEEDATRLTTTHVAEVAGVSVGSLYQYFPNRDAILAALIERTTDRYFAMFETTLAHAREAPIARVLEGLALGVLALFATRGKGQGALFAEMTALGLSAILERIEARYVQQIERFLVSRPELRLAHPRAAAYVLFHACQGVLRAVSTSRDPVEEQEIAQEVVRMFTAYLRPLAPSAG